MLKRILSVIIIIFMLAGLSLTSFAASYLLEYDADNNTYVISADSGLSVLVLEYGKTPADLDGGLKPAFLRQSTDKNEVVVDLAGKPSGKYTIYYKNGDTVGFVINYYNEATVSLSSVNSAASASALKAALESNEINLGINKNDLTNYSNLSTILYNLYFTKSGTRGFSSIVDFTKKYNAVLFCLSSADMTTVAEFGEKLYYYQTSTGISYKDDFEGLDAEVKQALFTVFKGYDFSDLDANTAYNEAGLLSIANKTPKWSDLMETLTVTHNSVLKLSIGVGSLYSALNDKEAVFKKMHAKISSSSYRTISELKASFDSIVLECYNGQNAGTQTGPAGSTGGGGGGGTIKQEIVTPNIPPNNSNPKFTDMYLALWADEAVNSLSEKNILAGYPDSTFKPLNSVTRAEFTKMIVNAFNLSDSSEIAFDDVNPADWFYEFIKIGVTNGIIMGNGEGFMPNDTITRQDAAVILFRTISKSRVLSSQLSEFSDNAEIADYAKEAVYAMKNAGIINGVGDNIYLPLGDTSRAAAATMIYNALNINW